MIQAFVPPEPADLLDRMSPPEVLAFARGLLAEMRELRSAYQDLRRDFAELKIEHQAVKDELARVKKLPPRPPIRPSGMEKATRRINRRRAEIATARNAGAGLCSSD